RPDADLRARFELGPLTAQHFAVAHQATVKADVLQFQQSLLAIQQTNHRVVTRHQRAGENYVVGRIAPNANLRPREIQHRAAAFVDFVEPDFHGEDFTWGELPRLGKDVLLA